MYQPYRSLVVQVTINVELRHPMGYSSTSSPLTAARKSLKEPIRPHPIRPPPIRPPPIQLDPSRWPMPKTPPTKPRLAQSRGNKDHSAGAGQLKYMH